MNSPIVTVYENSDPLLQFTLLIAGTTTPYDLTAATVEFYIKDAPTQGDGSPKKKYVGTVTDASGGIFTVQMDATDLTPAGRYWYKVDVTIGGNKDTVLAGRFLIIDV